MKRIKKTLENMGIRYEIEDQSAFVEFWTDTAGQDIPTEFDFDGTAEDFVKKFTEAAENYDVDSEVELYAGMRGQRGVPETIREIIDDCEEAKATLLSIAEALKKATTETNRTIYTLRTGRHPEEVVYPEEFTTYESAYDRMCREYIKDCKENPTNIKRWVIWETSYITWNGNTNSMTQRA